MGRLGFLAEHGELGEGGGVVEVAGEAVDDLVGVDVVVEVEVLAVLNCGEAVGLAGGGEGGAWLDGFAVKNSGRWKGAWVVSNGADGFGTGGGLLGGNDLRGPEEPSTNVLGHCV